MKIPLALCAVLFTGSAFAQVGGCSARTFSGTYLFKDAGQITSVGPYASAGIVTANGSGQGTILQTTSINGTITNNVKVDFRYAANADCSVNATTEANRHFTVYLNPTFVGVSKHGVFISTDKETTIVGTLDQ